MTEWAHHIIRSGGQVCRPCMRERFGDVIMTPQKIALLTDSCADLSPQLAAENLVFVVPLRIL